MKIKITKDTKIWLEAFIALALIIEPKLFTQYKITVLIYALGNVLLFLKYIIKLDNRTRVSSYLITWVVLRLYLLSVMFANGHMSDFDQWGYLSLMVANAILLICHYSKKGWIDHLLSAGTWVCIIFLAINAISLLAFPHGIIPSSGLYENGDGDFYFLGIKTAYTTYVFAAITFASLNYRNKRKKNSLVITIILSLFNVFYANISTGIICLLLLLLLLILRKVVHVDLSMKFILLFTITANIAIVFFDAQNLFSGLIVNILNKNITLTGRTEIWDYAIHTLKNNGTISFLFGNGIYNNGAFVNYGGALWPAHNQWLQNLYEYGFIGTLGLLYFFKISGKNVGWHSYKRTLLLNIIFVIMVGTVTMQYFGYAHIYIPFILLYFLGRSNYSQIR